MFQKENDIETSKKKTGRPSKLKKKKQYTLTMDEKLHDEINNIANEMGLSFSAYVCMLLKTNMHKGNI